MARPGAECFPAPCQLRAPWSTPALGRGDSRRAPPARFRHEGTPGADSGGVFSHNGTPSACGNCGCLFARSAEIGHNWVRPVAMISQAASPPDFPAPPPRAGNYSAEVVAGPRGPIAVYQFAFEGRDSRRLVVLKLDHYGGFPIRVAAPEKLRPDL